MSVTRKQTPGKAMTLHGLLTLSLKLSQSSSAFVPRAARGSRDVHFMALEKRSQQQFRPDALFSRASAITTRSSFEKLLARPVHWSAGALGTIGARCLVLEHGEVGKRQAMTIWLNGVA